MSSRSAGEKALHNRRRSCRGTLIQKIDKTLVQKPVNHPRGGGGVALPFYRDEKSITGHPYVAIAVRRSLRGDSQSVTLFK